jgi:hypothetical protein
MPEILSLSSEVASDFHWLISVEETTTFASTIDWAVTEDGLGGNGKRSAVPVAGGVNTERGKAGGALCLRIPALEGVGGGTDIWEEGEERFRFAISDRNNHLAVLSRIQVLYAHLSLSTYCTLPSFHRLLLISLGTFFFFFQFRLEPAQYFRNKPHVCPRLLEVVLVMYGLEIADKRLYRSA